MNLNLDALVQYIFIEHFLGAGSSEGTMCEVVVEKSLQRKPRSRFMPKVCLYGCDKGSHPFWVLDFREGYDTCICTSQLGFWGKEVSAQDFLPSFDFQPSALLPPYPQERWSAKFLLWASLGLGADESRIPCYSGGAC